MESDQHNGSSGLTWLTIFFLLGFILAKGFYTFYVVGDQGQPTWAYHPVKDLPGESAYAIYPNLPFPQHVRGKEGE
jgi:hypothetical protein